MTPTSERKLGSLWSAQATLPVVVAALACGALAVAMEIALRSPVRLPGHRALPGALALLLLAEAFAPLVLLALSAAVPAALSLLGFGTPWAIAGWLVPAAFILLFRPRSGARRARALLLFVTAGLLFGLLRYLALRSGMHHAPEGMRLAGHLCFGGAGGLIALAITRRPRG